MTEYRINAQYYQQFDAAIEAELPGEGYGGWQSAPIEIAREHTAVVVMHAWDTGTEAEYPGYLRIVELAGELEPAPERLAPDPVLDHLRAWRREKIFVGAHNEADVQRGLAKLDFMPQARPEGEEGMPKIASNWRRFVARRASIT